ncbi:alpha/beta hydrolase [Novosphingobium sp. AAP83]|uniref:alpha/beta hydrolase n=1 Tax=Novosphingobium sp. AAP83 TaxID=1523425 RepID=UPI0006B8DD09|nr:alpha/beta hydrolase [Novosphingobium sp. AAP83]
MSGTAIDDPEKAMLALKRAIPQTRMIDYGMARSDAAILGGLDGHCAGWAEMARSLSDRNIAMAVHHLSANRRAMASQYHLWAGAALLVGQLEFNHDSPEKVAMYREANALFARSADLGILSHHRLHLEFQGHRLAGWCFPHAAPLGAVVIVGGLSGWGTAYFGMARAMQARGLAVVLAEAPGQGETRMDGGLFLSRENIPLVSSFVDEAARHSARVGIMGNSFGALIAAHVATTDARITALCLNGAVPDMKVPDFRTAREQMEAVFGVEGPELARRVGDLGFDPQASPIACATLIVEGGADPLVAVGAQLGFLREGDRDAATVLTWPDGEHTIYNHATDRDALVSAWFVDHLTMEQ